MNECARRDQFLINPYTDWSKAQGIPIYEDFGVDLIGLETGKWAMTETNGAIVNLRSAGDYSSIYVIDIPEGGKTSQMQHCYEEIFYVLDGHGSTQVTLASGRVHTFEWGPKALFAIPLNSPFRFFNGSGRERARIVSNNNLRVSLKLYHNEDFLFRNPMRFPEREGPDAYFTGDGDLQLRNPGNHTWETNLIPDLEQLNLRAWRERGGASTNIMLVMADGTMHAHVSEMPVGTYKKAHQHGPDYYVYCVRGEGFSYFWYEGEEDTMVRLDWKPGWVFAPPDQMLHLHFNKGKEPCRYFASALGSRRYPFNDEKEWRWGGGDPKVLRLQDKQLEYTEQPHKCHLAFLAELEMRGIASSMGKEIDETTYIKELEDLKRAGPLRSLP